MCRQVYRYIVRYDSNCIFSLKLISYSWFLGVINLFAPRERKQETALKRGERKGNRFPWMQLSLSSPYRELIGRTHPRAQLYNFSFFFFFSIFIGVQLLYNVLLVSSEQQSELVTHIRISSLFLDFLPVYVSTGH